MVTQDKYSLIATQIIKEQSSVIGPLAVDQARKVRGIRVDNLENVEIIGDGKEVLGELVMQFEQIFGIASIEVCKEAVKQVKAAITIKDLPTILQ